MKRKKAIYPAILAVLLFGASSCKTTNIYLLPSHPSHPSPAIDLPIVPYYPKKQNRFSALADSAMREVLKEYSK